MIRKPNIDAVFSHAGLPPTFSIPSSNAESRRIENDPKKPPRPFSLPPVEAPPHFSKRGVPSTFLGLQPGATRRQVNNFETQIRQKEDNTGALKGPRMKPILGDFERGFWI
jgi:hypothetical protein